MPFKIEDESVYLKYTEIWNKIKNSLNSKFYSQPIYDDKYIKTKVKTFSSMINTLFSSNEIPQVCLEQCNYKIKKRKPVNFIDAEVDLSLDDSNDLDE